MRRGSWKRKKIHICCYKDVAGPTNSMIIWLWTRSYPQHCLYSRFSPWSLEAKEYLFQTQSRNHCIFCTPTISKECPDIKSCSALLCRSFEKASLFQDERPLSLSPCSPTHSHLPLLILDANTCTRGGPFWRRGRSVTYGMEGARD